MEPWWRSYNRRTTWEVSTPTIEADEEGYCHHLKTFEIYSSLWFVIAIKALSVELLLFSKVYSPWASLGPLDLLEIFYSLVKLLVDLSLPTGNRPVWIQTKSFKFTMQSLTTDNGRSSSSQNLNLTNHSMNSSSDTKVNTVVSQLVQQWRKLMKAECNIDFFAALLKKNIATRDIFYFVQKHPLL